MHTQKNCGWGTAALLQRPLARLLHAQRGGGDWVGTCASAEDSARACAGRVAAAHESGDVGGEEDVDEAAQLGLDASERVRHVLRHFGEAQLESKRTVEIVEQSGLFSTRQGVAYTI